MTTAKSEALIREKIGQQLARRSALQYDLEANQQAAANLQLLIDACDGNIRGLEQARSMMAEVEADLAKAYESAARPPPSAQEMAAQMAEEEWMERGGPPPPRRESAPAKPKPQKQPKAAQAPKPAKRRGRPPKAKPGPIADEPTQAGGSWNGNGGLTPEQAAAQ